MAPSCCMQECPSLDSFTLPCKRVVREDEVEQVQLPKCASSRTPCKRRRWYNEPTSCVNSCSIQEEEEEEEGEEQEASASLHPAGMLESEPSFLAWWQPEQQQQQEQEEEEVTSGRDSLHQPVALHGKPQQQEIGSEPSSRSVVREERQDRHLQQQQQQQQSLLGFSFFTMAIAV
ncbi:hypothetical protein DUNSADRAFT_3328 [Dunaliella salina]|uniref:Uncharacterized protein n=1 Tax=Dunaliella salina TaxID=3046 RepID=A0ABQ7GU68_DUNSA|nr:hypothetical protein DUNSADRAFT_3328 [Dunaliella salina]|eukprot:KAF5838134.1 hypothetical protein DUNSADRAFT_3328 [Dunaliella salina]